MDRMRPSSLQISAKNSKLKENDRIFGASPARRHIVEVSPHAVFVKGINKTKEIKELDTAKTVDTSTALIGSSVETLSPSKVPIDITDFLPKDLSKKIEESR